jgi:phosphate starvation-inducible PhoH-like protein
MNTVLYIIMAMAITNFTLFSRSYKFNNLKIMREISMKRKNINIDINSNKNVYYPKNKNQVKYINYLNDDNIKIVMATGAAGTGKTLFACLKAISLLKNNEINKVIITRPAISVDEEHGFLPGNINKKMEPWMKPILDIFDEFYSKSEVNNMLKNEIIEISPLAYMRGRTFKNTLIICDEMQNSSPNQMLMLTTRLGINSKMIITGDLDQSDKDENNGLKDLYDKVKFYGRSNMIKYIEFTGADVERSEIVKEILQIYGNDINSTKQNIDINNFDDDISIKKNDSKIIIEYLKNFNAKSNID